MNLTTTIVGTKFRGAKAVTLLGTLPKGLRLRLRREPDNEFDSNAIAVYYGDQHLGYVPRTDNAALAQALDRDPAAEHWAQLVDEAILDDRGGVRFSAKIAVHFD
jgi:hypothetical protein